MLGLKLNMLVKCPQFLAVSCDLFTHICIYQGCFVGTADIWWQWNHSSWRYNAFRKSDPLLGKYSTDSPHKTPVIRSFEASFVVSMVKRSSYSYRWIDARPWCSCDGTVMYGAQRQDQRVPMIENHYKREPRVHFMRCIDLDKSTWTFFSGVYFTILCCTEPITILLDI